MISKRISEEVVRFAGERRRLSSAELLCAGRSKRQHLHVDVSRIHFGDPPVAQFAELFQDFRRGTAEFQSLFFEPSPRAIEESRAREMFLQGYRSHKRSILLNVQHAGHRERSATIVDSDGLEIFTRSKT